ncbi:ORF MSV244 hypothetical protein [Melanoplus sanguinipes entomopoxvirus]|uniref:FHA domain-containing protein n=1 Tax=Melanoplus sanguinipes entomopoxvirus TaxID=83191 RepID=Q9YVJ8_MSEPV|nr:ORF MSV244 hypothetical protein [Melanoplus sanguinipes entomopoxvirus]AAC97741.1 ORF MSV244 hypothetical protein [Melanoplus sanguinipes entomopoxvirus 'O']
MDKVYKFGSLTNLNSGNIYNLIYNKNYTFTIGRNSKCDIFINDKKISNIACIIKCDYEKKKCFIYGGCSNSKKYLYFDNNDGLLQNGIFIKFPNLEWMDLSINGNIYILRSNIKLNLINELIDTTLIDISGNIYIWRSIDVKLNNKICNYSMCTSTKYEYMFYKCGHKINKKTATFWKKTKMLCNDIYTNKYKLINICPFCFNESFIINYSFYCK